MSREGPEDSLVLGECLLDRRRGLLLRDGAPVALRPKAFALLRHLADNAGRVVDKSELMAAVWPDVFVTEDSLTQAVRELRKGLGDEAAQMVRTIARRGYLLFVPAAAPPSAGRQATVAVLRFADGDGSDRHLVDGFAEEVLDALARFRTVAVLARNSSFTVASEAEGDWREVGKRLGADFLVRGNVRVRNGEIAVEIGLVDASNGAVQWSERFSARGNAILDLQHEIALKIVNRLVARLSDASLARTAAKSTTSLAAHEMLLRGLARFRGYGPDDNAAARDFFDQALQRDPDYALAHAYRALVDIASAGYAIAPAATIMAAKERASLAVALAPEEPRCHRVLSLVRLFAREHGAAEHHIRRSLELNPYDADTVAQLGYLLCMRGRPFEALAALDEAVRINPFHPDWYDYDRSIAFYSAGDYQGAIECLSRLAVLAPWKLTRLAACHAQLDDLARARNYMAELRRMAPDFSPSQYARTGLPFEHASDTDHFAEGVEKALAA